ncbi:MAG: YczE/YyaS/YitT family protein [Chloroflexota bacterium]
MSRFPRSRKAAGYSVSQIPDLRNLRNWTAEERWIWLRQFAMLQVGLFLFAFALMLSLYANIGANSWMVFHHGIALQSPLTIGQASQFIGLIMIFISWLAGIRPGFGTVLNMFLVGLFMDLIDLTGLVPTMTSLPGQVGMLGASILILGLSSGMYIKAGFGAGPRDSFHLAVIELTNLSITVSRWAIEASVVVLGILMGGQFGVGTIIYAALIGPSVGLGFRVFGLYRKPRERAETEATPAPAPQSD